MAIQFNSIPVNFYVPGQYVEFASSNAGNSSTVTVPQSILLVGQKLDAGSATAGVVVLAGSADEVGSLAGRGSMLHQMAKKAFAAAPLLPVYLLPLDDAETSAPSTLSVTFTGPATAAGEIDLYVGDSRYSVGVASGDAASAIATNVVAAIAADTDRYMDAAVDGTTNSKINLTARHGGVAAGAITVSVNRYTGEALPAGVTATIGALTAGAVNPTVDSTLYASLGETWYPTVVMPYTDATNLAAAKTELSDRFGPLRQIDGYAYAALNDTVTNLTALATTNNSPWQSVIDAGDLLTPAYVTAAAVAAVDAYEPDPSRPRQTLALPGLLAKTDSGRRTLANRNTLLSGGISTLRIDTDGTVRIERLTTTYRTNAYGVADDAYWDTTTLHTLMNLRYTLRVRFATRYPRSKLGQDGSIGANVVTPSTAKAEIVALYRDTWMTQGWVEGGDALTQFKTDLVTEIDSGDPNRLNALIPPNIINGLRVLAAQVDFIR